MPSVPVVITTKVPATAGQAAQYPVAEFFNNGIALKLSLIAAAEIGSLGQIQPRYAAVAMTASGATQPLSRN